MLPMVDHTGGLFSWGHVPPPAEATGLPPVPGPARVTGPLNLRSIIHLLMSDIMGGAYTGAPQGQKVDENRQRTSHRLHLFPFIPEAVITSAEADSSCCLYFRVGCGFVVVMACICGTGLTLALFRLLEQWTRLPPSLAQSPGVCEGHGSNNSPA